MKILRKIIIAVTAALCAVSCLDKGTAFTNAYTMDASFEYRNMFGLYDSLYVDKNTGQGIGFQDMAFYHKLNGDGREFLGGFIASRLRGGGSSDENRFRVNSGAGYNNSSTYLVFYSNPNPSDMPKNDVAFLSGQYGTCRMIGCYVNNTKEVYEAVKKNFVDGDRLAIRMTGYLGGEKTGEQEFVLAEYTAEKDSVVTSWSPYNLDKLGTIDVIDIEVISTRSDIPAAFCMDDMFARIEISY